MFNSVVIGELFSFAWSDVHLLKNLRLSLWFYKACISFYFCPEADRISKCGHTFKKTVSFDDIVHYIHEENIVTYVDFDKGISFYPEAPTKVEQFNPERKNFSR